MEVRKKVVVGEEEANQIFLDFHDSAHVTSRFYWPGMGVDLDKWVNGII